MKEVTVKEFIDWLGQFPELTKVKVAMQQKAPAWESYGAIEFKTPDLADYGDGWDYNDGELKIGEPE